jgi:hypothetical protein
MGGDSFMATVVIADRPLSLSLFWSLRSNNLGFGILRLSKRTSFGFWICDLAEAWTWYKKSALIENRQSLYHGHRTVENKK